jgi:hypothetical protein
MMYLNHLLVPSKIEELIREAEHQRLVELARSTPPPAKYSPPRVAHDTHYRIIRRIEPRALSIQSVPRHHRAA